MNEIEKELSFTQIQKYRVFIKMYLLKDVSGGEFKVLYLQDFLPYGTLIRFKWYFRYRTALFQIENPRNICELVTTPMVLEPNLQDKIRILQNRLTNAKGKVTEFTNAIEKHKQWHIKKNPLFPESYQTEKYYEVFEKLQSKKFLVRTLESEILKLKAEQE